jgi:hypothetical protein
MALAGCCKPQIIREPGPTVYVDRLKVQPVDARLLVEHPIAEGAPSECIAIAAQRKAEIEACNAHKRAIRGD